MKDLLLDIKNDIFEVTLFQHLAYKMTNEIGNCQWERFFEKVIKEVKKVKNINIIERRRNIWQEKEEHMKNL